MNPESIFTGVSTGVVLCFLIFCVIYAVVCFIVPFLVWGIYKNTWKTNLLLNEMNDILSHQAAEAKRQTENPNDGRLALIHQESANQTKVLTRLATLEEQLLQHAVYQTEVTKHRISSSESL